jgi:hypothetical protein
MASRHLGGGGAARAEAGAVSAAVREAIRHLDGRWVRLWLRGGGGPVAGIVRLRTDDAGFLLEQPGGAVQPLEYEAVAYWSGLELAPEGAV